MSEKGEKNKLAAGWLLYSRGTGRVQTGEREFDTGLTTSEKGVIL